MWPDDPNREDTDHFPLFQFGDMLLEYQPPFGFDFGLLPDGVLGEELIGRRECRVVMDIRVPLE